MRPILLILLLGGALLGEPIEENRGASALWHSLQQLQSTARVLHITAHPDDEDGATLTWLSRAKGAHVVLLSLTRGESGANRITGHFFDERGALRTLELEKAAAYYGAKLRFTRFSDFGFSKTLEETFRQWDREAVLADVVRIVREEKPHVVIARWRGDSRDGHGHHQAAGVAARLAFEAAGDPNRFPDQIRQGLDVWQPSKFYVGNRRGDEDWTVEVPAGSWDPITGQTYAQIAMKGLRRQRTQGAGSAMALPLPAPRYYKWRPRRWALRKRKPTSSWVWIPD